MHFVTKIGAALTLLGAFAALPASAQVTVNLYDTATDTGSGVTFASLHSTFQSPQISFLTDNFQEWFPLGYKEFGADMTGTITAPTTGTYTFTMNSDDGSYLFLNGSSTPFINNGGDHIPTAMSNSLLLTANTPVAFEIQYHENGTGDSGVDLSVTPPGGVSEFVPASYFAAPVPEASTTASFGLLLTLGLGGMAVAARKKRSQA